MAEPVITVAVLGSGVWGAAFGRALAAKHCAAVFWDRDSDVARQAADYPHCRFAESINQAVAAADVIIVAVATAGFSTVLKSVADTGGVKPLLWLTKGFAPASGKPLYEVAGEILPGHFGVISGPSFAAEVNQGKPAALSLVLPAAEDGWLRERLHRPHLRLYLNDDIIGVCIAGALKNVIAIAAGISDGLQLGENARAALITRGLAEMQALSLALGGKPETLLGLCGVGDLTLTCCSDLSRNRQLGLRIVAAGAQAASDGSTCEGISAAAAACSTAREHGLAGSELPIISAVAAVLAGELSPESAVAQLLARPPR